MQEIIREMTEVLVDQFEYVHKVQAAVPFQLGESVAVPEPFSGSKSEHIKWSFTVIPLSGIRRFCGYHTECQVKLTGRNGDGKERDLRVRVTLSSEIFRRNEDDLIFSNLTFSDHAAKCLTWTEDTVRYMPHDFSIKIKFEVIRCLNGVSPSSNSNAPVSISTGKIAPEVLQKSLKGMLDSGDFADIVVTTSEGDIPAHKNMLAARSPVFRAMFSTDMLETNESRVNIVDFKKSIVFAMLQYIYTGCTDEITKSPLDMLLIADKYDLKELREACLSSVTASITIENATSKLVMADRLHLEVFKKAVVQFFRDNHLGIAKTQDFKEFVNTNHDLYLEVLAGGSGSK